MKILFLSQIVPYPPHGGVLQRGYNLLRELGGRATVDLLAFVHPDELRTAEHLQESRRALGAFCRTVEYYPLWAKRSPAHTAAALAWSAVSPVPFSVIAHRSAAYGRRVANAISSNAYDAIHVDTIGLSEFVSAPPRKVPRVLTHHNVESMLMERRAAVESRAGARQYLTREAAKLRRFESRICPSFDANIVVSAQDGQALADRIPGVRTALVPNGVDTDYFSPDGTPQEPAFIYTGGMNMFANRDAITYFLGEIWPLIRREAPEAHFIAVGQDPPRELRAAAEADSGVTATGFVEDIRPYVRRAAVYVVPIRVGGGTRLKVLDSMAMGKALVSTSVGCEGVDVRDGKHVIVADSPRAFADAAVALLRDPERRRALGRSARDLVERRYAWRVVGDQLLAAYAAAGAGAAKVTR